MHDWLRSGPLPSRLARAVVLFVVMALVVPGTAFAVILGTYLFLPLPSALPAENPQIESQISTVYAIDGTPIGQFRRAEQAIPVPSDQIPDTIRRAVIAAEDHDFFQHGGVDFEAVGRALVHNLTAGRIVEGGSTITQQLVKHLYVGAERSFVRKAREALFAAQLERELSKDEILARYLNTIYLGDSAFGVEAASRSYFRKPAQEVTLSEAALLAGLIPAPSRFSPRSHPEVAEQRRHQVLDQMLDHGLATPEEVEAARAEVPVIHPPPGVEGRYPYFLDYVRRYLLDVKGYDPELIYRGGLTIETTLDPQLEEHALAVVNGTLDDPGDPEASLVAVEPSTGFVRALVGGRDWESNKVNLALGKLGGGGGRQAGSAFKVFTLARALEAGVSPNKTYPAPRCVSLPGWNPCNYGGAGYGSATLRTATVKSINTVYAQLILDVGVKETAEMARRLGITSVDPELAGSHYGGALTLGAVGVSPLDMASAFSVFGARGMRAEPTPILKITDREGNVLEDNTEPKRNRVLREVIADHVNEMLEGVIAGGTARRADIGRPAAGKTGTEDGNVDAWFVGYTPALSTAVWMGHKDEEIPMHNVQGVGQVTGGSLPARMWADFMREALRNVPETDFSDPAPLDSLKERALRQQRGGLEIGRRRSAPGTPSGTFYAPPGEPEAGPPPDIEPTTTTSSTVTTTSTTTTTRPPLFGGGSTTTTTEPDGGGGGGPGPF